MNGIAYGIAVCVFSAFLFVVGFVASAIGFNGSVFYILALLLIAVAIYLISAGRKNIAAASVGIDTSSDQASGSLPAFKSYVFYTSGVGGYCSERIFDLYLNKNDSEYDLPKREMISIGLVDDKIYRLEPYYSPAFILPDPNNKHDPNSLKVVLGNVQVGFVPDDKVQEVRDLLAMYPDAEINCYITGGDYKLISEDYSEGDRPIYTSEQGSDPVQVQIAIRYKPASETKESAS